MEKVNLKAKAKECLEFNKDEDAVIVVEDGTCFLTKAKNHAVNYAQSKGLKYQTITKEDIADKEDTKSEPVKKPVKEPVADETSTQPKKEDKKIAKK